MNNPIYRFNTRGAKGYVQALTVELSIQTHLKVLACNKVLVATVYVSDSGGETAKVKHEK